jgi:hypothetical protein
MSGNRPIAVFEIAGKEELVQLGGSVSGGYTLETVLGNMAILNKKGKKLTLTMGSPK